MTEVKSITEIIKEIREPEVEHTLVYDSTSETLEPLYFFIVDLMENVGLTTEKLVDNFVSSPGSGHFAELGQRATIMQQNASRIMGDVNTVLRSVLNIIYDLKEFKIRLEYYDDLNSKSKEKVEAAKLALKQIWMDRVDIGKGNSSIKAMAVQGGFQTLIDAFLSANTAQDVDKLDLNDIVKRILKPRIQEFNIWLDQSEKELRKRFELERTYLRSQVNSLKLYSRWAKPYLKAAQQLEMKESGRSPDLVKTFNTIILELTLLGKSKIDIEKSIDAGDMPPEVKKVAKSLKRDYYNCILVDFSFRGIPQKIAPQQPHYVFGGKTEVTFTGYALNDDELNKIEEELKKSDIEDVLKLVEGATTESIEQLQEEINLFLEESPEGESRKEKEKPKPRDTSNPFLALLGRYETKEEKKPEKKEKEKPKKIAPDNFIEKTHLRAVAAKKSADMAFDLFDIYKQAHGMPSYT
jgi:hypothetical protein